MLLEANRKLPGGPRCRSGKDARRQDVEVLRLLENQPQARMKQNCVLIEGSHLEGEKANRKPDFRVGDGEIPFVVIAGRQLFPSSRGSLPDFREETLLPDRPVSRLFGKMLRLEPKRAKNRWRGRLKGWQSSWRDNPDDALDDRARKQQACARVLTAGESRGRRRGFLPLPTV